MALRLRALGPNDLEAAVQCGMAAWISSIAPLIDDFSPNEMMRIEKAFRLFLLGHISGQSAATDHLAIGDLGGQIIGFYNLDCVAAELTDLWIAPRWQGQGIASAMMAEAKQKCRQMGHQLLELEVMAGNQRAFAFYRKEGFAEFDRKVRHDPTLERSVEKLLMRTAIV